MNEKEMLAELQVKDFDLDKFVSLVLANKETRDFMINNLFDGYYTTWKMPKM